MLVTRSILCAAIVAGALPGIAEAAAPTRLRMVDQGYEDSDPLRTSFRVLNHDLRQPIGFSQLFEDTQNPGTYVRVSGGLYQVSKNTKYIHTEDGTFVGISAGTVFYIGTMPEPPSWDRGSSPSATRQSLPLALPIRSASQAREILTAQLVAPAAVRAADLEHDHHRATQANALHQDPAVQPGDIGDELTRADRLRAISQRVLQGN